MKFLETYETDETKKIKAAIERNEEDIELTKSKLKQLKQESKKLEADLDLINNKYFLDNYTEYYYSNKENYDNFWKSIEDGTNSNLSKWEEEFKNLPKFARVKTTFHIVENNASMKIFLQDGLCTYSIHYLPANDILNKLKVPAYYLVAENTLAGPFIEQYITCNEQTLKDLLLIAHKFPVITPQQVSRVVLRGDYKIHRHLELFEGKNIPNKTGKAIIRSNYINESKTLYYIAVRKEDGKYYPTTYTSIKKKDLKEKMEELCCN